MSSDPYQRAFARDQKKPPFLAGVDRGKWRVASESWPYVVMAVRNASHRVNGGPEQLGLRFDLTGYPGRPPTAAPWDLGDDELLPAEQWPSGGRVSLVFNPNWRRDALYMPFDRVALDGHDGWATQHPGYVWDVDSDITLYLDFVLDLLDGYQDPESEEDVDAAEAG